MFKTTETLEQWAHIKMLIENYTSMHNSNVFQSKCILYNYPKQNQDKNTMITMCAVETFYPCKAIFSWLLQICPKYIANRYPFTMLNFYPQHSHDNFFKNDADSSSQLDKSIDFCGFNQKMTKSRHILC